MPDLLIEPSLLGLYAQWAGALLFVLLLGLQTEAVPRPWIVWWWRAFCARAAALTALSAMFYFETRSPLLLILYLAGNYAFGLGLLAGARRFIGENPLSRTEAWAVAWAVVPALVTPLLLGSFDGQYGVHSGFMALLLLLSLRAWRKRPWSVQGFGSRVFTVSLALATVGFFFDLFFYVSVGLRLLTPPFWLAYDPFFDLMLQVLLGFGMGIASLERLQEELAEASRHLEALARRDPLTEALNRHAFYALTDGSGPGRAGSVVLLDLNGLKQLNDRFGHAAGDAAIRAVASAARETIRADDLLFRWGGDEFLAILWGLPEEEAEARFSEMAEGLTRTPLAEAPGAALGASFGVAACSGPGDLEHAVALADARMYERKRQLRHQVATGG